MKKIDWENYFKLPFYNDYGRVVDKDYHFTFQFNNERLENLNDKIIAIINGDLASDFKHNFRYEDGEIFNEKYKDMPIITLRGWGYLTGIKRLSSKDAREVQDKLGKYIINKLNNDERTNNIF